jgi:phospholipid/cholesterol/gamma-HCH transport system substrate-binding protein
MDDRVMQFRVGVFFLFTLLLTGILLVMFGKLPQYVGKYQVQVQFDNAGGISPGTPVRKSGLVIGRVGNIQLTDNDEKVLVTLEIQSDKTIYKNEECSIVRNLFGDTAVQFAAAKDGKAAHVPVELDKPILGERPSEDPTGMQKVLEKPINRVNATGDALTDASKKLGVAADQVSAILDKKAQARIERIIENIAESMDVIKKGLGDAENQKKLAKALSDLPDTLENMKATFAKTDKALTLFTESKTPGEKSPVERLVHTIEMTERSLHDFSQPSENGGPPPVDQIAKAVGNINEITALMRNIMSRIDRGEGSLGALLKDRQLYNRLNKAAQNIEQVSRELRPIVEDAGVFMDKAARHPGVIVRDAVKPGVGIK